MVLRWWGALLLGRGVHDLVLNGVGVRGRRRYLGRMGVVGDGMQVLLLLLLMLLNGLDLARGVLDNLGGDLIDAVSGVSGAAMGGDGEGRRRAEPVGHFGNGHARGRTDGRVGGRRWAATARWTDGRRCPFAISASLSHARTRVLGGKPLKIQPPLRRTAR